MGQKLQGRKFYINSNNGVTVLVEDIVHRNWMKRYEIRLELLKSIPIDRLDRVTKAVHAGTQHMIVTPIFTFVAMNRYQDSPWFTGATLLFERLCAYIRHEGGSIVEQEVWVPFSNGLELGLHGRENQTEALAYVTTEHQFRDTFGATPFEVLASSF